MKFDRILSWGINILEFSHDLVASSNMHSIEMPFLSNIKTFERDSFRTIESGLFLNILVLKNQQLSP